MRLRRSKPNRADNAFGHWHGVGVITKLLFAIFRHLYGITASITWFCCGVCIPCSDWRTSSSGGLSRSCRITSSILRSTVNYLCDSRCCSAFRRIRAGSTPVRFIHGWSSQRRHSTRSLDAPLCWRHSGLRLNDGRRVWPRWRPAWEPVGLDWSLNRTKPRCDQRVTNG